MLTHVYLHQEMTPNIESRKKPQRRYVDTVGLMHICQANISLIPQSTWHTHISSQMYVLASHSWRPSITLRQKQNETRILVTVIHILFTHAHTHIHMDCIKHIKWTILPLHKCEQWMRRILWFDNYENMACRRVCHLVCETQNICQLLTYIPICCLNKYNQVYRLRISLFITRMFIRLDFLCLTNACEQFCLIKVNRRCNVHRVSCILCTSRTGRY